MFKIKKVAKLFIFCVVFLSCFESQSKNGKDIYDKNFGSQNLSQLLVDSFKTKKDFLIELKALSSKIDPETYKEFYGYFSAKKEFKRLKLLITSVGEWLEVRAGKSKVRMKIYEDKGRVVVETPVFKKELYYFWSIGEAIDELKKAMPKSTAGNPLFSSAHATPLLAYAAAYGGLAIVAGVGYGYAFLRARKKCYQAKTCNRKL